MTITSFLILNYPLSFGVNLSRRVSLWFLIYTKLDPNWTPVNAQMGQHRLIWPRLPGRSLFPSYLPLRIHPPGPTWKAVSLVRPLLLLCLVESHPSPHTGSASWGHSWIRWYPHKAVLVKGLQRNITNRKRERVCVRVCVCLCVYVKRERDLLKRTGWWDYGAASPKSAGRASRLKSRKEPMLQPKSDSLWGRNYLPLAWGGVSLDSNQAFNSFKIHRFKCEFHPKTPSQNQSNVRLIRRHCGPAKMTHKIHVCKHWTGYPGHSKCTLFL